MQYEKKYLGNGSGNFDDADFIVQPNQWVNMENCRVLSTDKGVIGTVESIGSNVLLSPILPSVTFVEIGSIADEANHRIIYFLKDTYGPWDKIICYDIVNDVFYNVLFANQVIGGLNFSKDNLIHSARIVNGLLYWTDNVNQPRRLNIEAGINLNHPGTFSGVTAYSSPMNASVITIIRKPPAYPLIYSKIEDSEIDSNQIENNSFRFSYQYIYRDGEISTLAPHSLIANYNYPDDSFNAIQISVSLNEIPDQDTQKINIIVIYADTETGFIIKTWDKANPVDAIEIADHVAGTAQLQFEFANDAVGEAIDAATLVKPYDVVPLNSETLEQASNRIFLGRNVIGYDSPVSVSLTASVYNASSTLYFGLWYLFSYTYTSTGCTYVAWFIMYFPVDMDGTHPAGYYGYTPTPLLTYVDLCGSGPAIFPTMPLAEADITYIGAAVSDVETYIAAHDQGRLGVVITSRTLSSVDYWQYNSLSVLIGGTGPNASILKSDSAYRLGVVFYDQYLRQCGVVVGPKITTPDREYADSTSLDYGIQWNLPGGIQDEIPNWAYYYSVVVTKSLRTSFFAQARASTIVYATKNTDGNYVFTSTTYSDSSAGIALKLDLLNGAGLGYSFSQGDIIKIYVSGGSIYQVGVIGQAADFVIGELVNLGSTTGILALFEIYTPRPQSAAGFYYEVGSFYSVTNPTQSIRTYSTLSGLLPGDVYLLRRGTSPNEYLTENMSPSTTYWRNWFTNAGRIQIKDSIGQRVKDTSIKWSNTFIPGTITNGLSAFDSLDEKILPGEMGPLRKLQITSKVNNEQGAVMLGLCEQETASMYLGEQQLVASAANAFVAQSLSVIGTVNILKGSFGTINPESVIEFRGNVYWIDVPNGKVVQYSLNGLFPISNYKMTRYWKLFCDQYLSMTTAQIEALGSRPYIFTTVDPHHWELLVTVPKLLETPPMGYLPDAPYTDYVYPFDIWDGQAKTLVYKINAEPNFWQGSYSFAPEGYVTVQNKLYSFKYGQLYEHNNTDLYCNFYDVQYKSRIMPIYNQIPDRPKVYNNASIEANMLPSLMYFMSLEPYTQVSNLQDFDWENKEGVLYSQLYRNVLTPSATGLKTNALVTGEKMRTNALRVLLEFEPTTFPVELRFVTLGYSLSLGHTIPLQ